MSTAGQSPPIVTPVSTQTQAAPMPTAFDWEAELAAPIPPCMSLLHKSVTHNKVDNIPLHHTKPSTHSVLSLSPFFPPAALQIISGSEYATLATISSDGNPTSRTIWVRELYQTRALLFTTDARTPKVEELGRSSHPLPPSSPPSSPSSPTASSTVVRPCGEVCWYLPMGKEQFRLTVASTVITASHPSPLFQRLRHSVWTSSPDWLQSTFDNSQPGLRKGEGADAEQSAAAVGGVHPLFVVVLLWPLRCDYLRLPVTVIDNTRPLHRESRLKPQKEQLRFLHTRHSAQQWTVTELNP